ncbi:MAG: tRNA (adenosine(37)-N6)-dimethylallyltransferase MiaA [Lachnospiraceae bacterium]|nr:tRNA (adenosine(37)-N6)-dimethylallyltransferase MiaA [Lachnospiraceae bacterium]
MIKQPFIILSGPTAVGKTELSVRLAEKIQGSIISADSMQVYRHMDIGSAKIKPEEMHGIPHYLIDELEPQEEFNIVTFQTLAKRYLKEIYAAGRIPILAGGTGFYIQSVLYDIDFSQEESSDTIRRELEAFARQEGSFALHQRLNQVDEASAKAIHPNNVKRVIRALEFYEQNGYPISKHNEEERRKKSPYNFAYFVLNDHRAAIYQRIEQRIDQMMDDGLLQEVKQLKELGCHKGMISMQGLGYKELLAYLDGELSLEEAIYILKRDTRHFAKRQLTWFGREQEAIWLNKDAFAYNEDAILANMISILKEKRIL